jgi:hypothetical protein
MRKLVALSLLLGAISIVKADSIGGLPLGNWGFLYSAGAYSPIVVPGSQITVAYRISDAGQIVGLFANSSSGPIHGFMDNAGSFTTIHVPGAISTGAFGINDAGQIVGVFTKSSGGGPRVPGQRRLFHHH